MYHDNIPTYPSIPYALPNPYHHATHTTHHNTQAYYHETPSTITSGLYHLGLGSIGDIRKLFHLKASSSDMVFTPANMILCPIDCPTNLWNLSAGIGGGSGSGSGGSAGGGSSGLNSGSVHGNNSGNTGNSSGGGNSSNNNNSNATNPLLEKYAAFAKFGGPEYTNAMTLGMSGNAGTSAGTGGGGLGGNNSSSNPTNHHHSSSAGNTLLRPQFLLFCLSGHKLYSTFLPSLDHAHNRDRLTYLREVQLLLIALCLHCILIDVDCC